VTVTKATVQLPDWAEEWVRGKCGCGARLCRAACYCGGHVVCSASGRDTEKCELPDEPTP